MSKSILIIDTPESCMECPCHFTDMVAFKPNGEGIVFSFLCGANNKGLEGKDVNDKIPDWCPLKKIPTKYAERDYTPIETKQYMEGYEDGYNDCIDNILKERDGNE